MESEHAIFKSFSHVNSHADLVYRFKKLETLSNDSRFDRGSKRIINLTARNIY